MRKQEVAVAPAAGRVCCGAPRSKAGQLPAAQSPDGTAFLTIPGAGHTILPHDKLVPQALCAHLKTELEKWMVDQ
jgi:hypothetical protein